MVDVLTRIALRIRDLESNPKLLRKAITFASLNWLLDAASLWVFMAAFGYRVNPDALLVAYGLANVLAAIPITPGGLGIVEGVLTSTLVGFGSPRAIAILGVISYRLINFWLPIPIGGLIYLSLGRRGSAEPKIIREARIKDLKDGSHNSDNLEVRALAPSKSLIHLRYLRPILPKSRPIEN